MGLRLRAKTDDERRLEALEKAERQRVKQQKSEQKKAQKQLKAVEKEAQKQLKAVEKEAQKQLKAAKKETRQREKSAQKEARELARRAEKELAALEKQARKAAGRMRAAEKRARKDEKRERKAREREARKAQKQQRRGSGPAPPKFAKKSHCHACARAFTATRRRHHCRLCRSSCCLACMAATRHPLPVYNQKRPQKVCVVCDVLHFEQGEVGEAPPTSEARGAAPAPPADAAATASSSEQLAAPIVALAVHRSTRRPNSAPLPSTTPQAAPVARPPTSAPVVRIRKPKTRAQSSKWLGGLLRRKSSATLRSWGTSAPVGRHLLDVHLAKTAELLAQASSRTIELREQPELAVAV